MAQPKTWNFPDCVRGDTISPMQFKFFSNDEPIELDTAFFYLLDKSDKLIKKFECDTSHNIVKTPFFTAEFTERLPSGNYSYRLRIVSVCGKTKTYVIGNIKLI